VGDRGLLDRARVQHAATLGLIVAVVGVHSPGTLIVSFLPMLCIAYAFRELNKADPDCGTTFHLDGPGVRPAGGLDGRLGDHRGRRHRDGQPGADRRAVLPAAGRPAGAGTIWVTVAGVAFIGLLTAVCYRGIEVSARLQQVLLVIEVGALAVFAIVALVKAGPGTRCPARRTRRRRG
jgi:amino acid transporter